MGQRDSVLQKNLLCNPKTQRECIKDNRLRLLFTLFRLLFLEILLFNAMPVQIITDVKESRKKGYGTYIVIRLNHRGTVV